MYLNYISIKSSKLPRKWIKNAFFDLYDQIYASAPVENIEINHDKSKLLK